MNKLNELLQAAKPMTDEQRREQAISFAYANAALHNPDVTREMVKSNA